MSFEDHARELAGYFRILGKRMKRMEVGDPTLCEFISVQEAHVLHSVGTAGRMTMSEIAAAIGLSLSSATALVDKLEARKWVRRERSEEDRRVVRVVLTAQGSKFYEMIENAHMKLTTDILGTLGEKEQAQLVSLFRKITGQLERS